MSASRVTTVPTPDRAMPDQVPAPRQVAAPGRLSAGRVTGMRAKLSHASRDMLPPGTLTVGAGLSLALITTAPGEVTVRVVTAYAAGCATVAVVLAIVLLRHSPITGQDARRRAPAWPTVNQ